MVKGSSDWRGFMCSEEHSGPQNSNKTAATKGVPEGLPEVTNGFRTMAETIATGEGDCMTED